MAKADAKAATELVRRLLEYAECGCAACKARPPSCVVDARKWLDARENARDEVAE